MILPEYISLNDWADSLFIDFPNDNVPILRKSDDWKEWGDFLIQCNSFQDNDAPSPIGFDDWKSWANAVYLSMNNNP